MSKPQPRRQEKNIFIVVDMNQNESIGSNRQLDSIVINGQKRDIFGVHTCVRESVCSTYCETRKLTLEMGLQKKWCAVNSSI